jgi:hypothetical protein
MHNSIAKPLVVQVRSCWTDIAEAIEAAKDFIYITGWSMHPHTRLTRDEADGGITIGDLLKQKAASRVCVCLLVCPAIRRLRRILVASQQRKEVIA